MRAGIALGSNLGDRESTIRRTDGIVQSRTGFGVPSGRVVSARMTKERISAPTAALIASQSGIGRSDRG